VTDRVISIVLVVEREEPDPAYGVQCPIYFISEVLNESKTRYTQIQKLIYAILITTRKLKHYFDGFYVVIKTEFPLGTIIRNKDANRRIAKWLMELCPFDLEFTRRDTIKSQTLADFVVEWTNLSILTSQGPVEYWKMYFDGSLTIDGAREGILFISPTNEQLRYVLRFHFPASNNAAEYETCFHGLRIAVDLGIKRLYVHSDSALVINQLNKDWDTTSEKMDAYYKEIRKLEGKFYGIEYSHVV
jgi:ribonuclease HI